MEKGNYRGKNLSNLVKFDRCLVTKAKSMKMEAKAVQAAFRLPRENIKFNEDRYLQITAVLRQYVSMTFSDMNPLFYKECFKVFGFMDNLFSQSHREFCETMARHSNWFKVFALSGRRNQGDMLEKEWDARGNCPILLRGLVMAFCKETQKASCMQMIRVVLSLLTTYKVLVVPVLPNVNSISDKFTGTDEDGSMIDIKQCLLALGLDLDMVRADFATLCQNAKFHETMAAGPNGHAL